MTPDRTPPRTEGSLTAAEIRSVVPFATAAFTGCVALICAVGLVVAFGLRKLAPAQDNFFEASAAVLPVLLLTFAVERAFFRRGLRDPRPYVAAANASFTLRDVLFEITPGLSQWRRMSRMVDSLIESSAKSPDAYQRGVPTGAREALRSGMRELLIHVIPGAPFLRTVRQFGTANPRLALIAIEYAAFIFMIALAVVSEMRSAGLGPGQGAPRRALWFHGH